MKKRKKLVVSIGFAVILVTCIIIAIFLIRDINNTEYDPLDKSLITPVYIFLVFPIILLELSLLRSVYKLISSRPKPSTKFCYIISIVIVCAALFFQLLVCTNIITENIFPEGPKAASSRFIEMHLLIEWTALIVSFILGSA